MDVIFGLYCTIEKVFFDDSLAVVLVSCLFVYVFGVKVCLRFSVIGGRVWVFFFLLCLSSSCEMNCVFASW